MINEEDVHFRDLFRPDTLENFCQICSMNFKSARSKKKHMFLYHYGTTQQVGGWGLRMSDLPINILRRGTIPYYSITFDQHKFFYDFFRTDVVDSFLNSFYQVYRPDKKKRSKVMLKLLISREGKLF